MNDLPYLQWGKNFANTLNLEANKNILDLGCRRGKISAHLAKKFPNQKFLAIDNLPNEIEYTKDIHLPNLDFEIANALKLEYTDYFDAVISFHCLLWIQNKYKVLQNIYRALKPGKKCYLQFFILHGRPKNDRFLYQVAQYPQWKTYFKNFTPKYFEIAFSEFSGLLQNIGFLIHRMEIVQYKIYFEHTEQLKDWLKSWGSHQERIPSHKQDHFLNETVNLYLNFHHYQHMEFFPYYEYFLEVEFEKPLSSIASEEQRIYQYKNIIFTPAEAKVLKFFLQGKTTKEISRTIGISPKTVEFHLSRIKEKLGLKLRSEIYSAAMDYGFIHLLFNTRL